MGEHKLSVVLRAGGAAAVSVAAAVALTSCSLIQVAPSPVATSSPDASSVVDPSTPSETPSASASASPTPSAVPSWSPEPTPTLTTEPGSTKKAVTPFITMASWDATDGLRILAMVPTLVENGGTCTATVTNGSVTRTASATATAISSYTGCDPITVPSTALSTGTWTVRVAYSSKTAAGTSAAKTVEVTR